MLADTYSPQKKQLPRFFLFFYQSNEAPCLHLVFCVLHETFFPLSVLDISRLPVLGLASVAIPVLRLVHCIRLQALDSGVLNSIILGIVATKERG